jgi:HEAT repeat protein
MFSPHPLLVREVPVKQRFFLFALLSLTLCSVSGAQNSFQSADVDSALRCLGLTPGDFVSDRIWAEDDTFLLPKVREALRSPQEAYAVARELVQTVPTRVEDAGKINGMCGMIAANCPEVVCRDIDAQLAAARPTSLDPFEPMLSAFALAEGYRTQAFSALTPAEQQALVLAAPLWFKDEESSGSDTLKGMLQRAFGAAADTTQKVDADSVLTLLSKVNRDALAAATYAFARGLATTVESWKTAKPPFSVTTVNGVDGLVIATRETAYGTFVLGGSGPNVYNGDFALIIDLGGDDRYNSRAGAAVNGLSRTVSAVIDLGGNDLYLSPKAANFACGVLGLGAVVDVSGDDVYRSGAFSQAAAFCGAALLFDGGGDDLYRAGLFAQGAAVCGVALLVDGGGRDVYDLTEYGQGFASTFAAAALVDNGGNDVYRAGGFDPHTPLRPEDYRSFAQGFAVGSRPRGGGGLALLYDRAGNDSYIGEIYAQGVGYWYSLGALVDEAGNDVYSAVQYSQGAGIHLAAGVLEDCTGDDRYTSRFGPGQGGAHDLSVAFLYDHAGDDQYTISGGQGMAITNSGALFFDAAGNDAYYTSENGLGQGGVREARGFGNLAVFADGEGRDTYADPLKSDFSVWMQGIFASGYDVARDSVRPREAEVQVTLTPEDEQRSIEDLFRDASRWEVTDNRERVKRARLALEKKGVEAVRWVGENKLNTNDALERRAIVQLFKTNPDSAAPYLRAALNGSNREGRRTAISVLGEIKYRGAVGDLISKLHHPDYERLRPSILSALGEIGDSSATGICMEFARSSNERERIAATVALGKLGDPRAWSTIFARFNDSLCTVRSAAMLAVAAQGSDVLSELQRQMGQSEPARLELLLLSAEKLAARWSGDEKLNSQLPKLAGLVRRYVDHPDPRVQGAALLACADSLPRTDVRKLLNRFSTVADPVLKSRVRQVQLKLR